MPGPAETEPTATAIGVGLAFGALLRRHRWAAGLTQDELAERAGLSTRGIAALERGDRRAPYRETVQRLANALQLDDDERAGLTAAARRVIVRDLPMAAEGFSRLRLPTPLSSFVGRQREVAEVLRLLQTTRLLTLTGAGGIGKTRLALEVARAVAGESGEKVALVDLAPLADPSLVVRAVAAALRVLEQPGRPLLEVLANALAAEPLLLLLDNCEHVIGACADAASVLLRACPALRILATSREKLAVEGETTWRVPGLAVPGLRSEDPPEALARFGAVRMFVERAGASRPDFVLTERNAAAVADVCRRLDGMPLAIELAAARVRVLGMDEIAERLEDRFRLLAASSRSAPPRQQTLRAALDWSYTLLGPQERQLFERLSVFAGGCSLEAVESVCVDYDAIARSEVLDVLSRLVDKSLVLAETREDSITRYRLLETLRAFGQERLAETGNAETFRRRHALFFVSLAERAQPELDHAQHVVWIERLERDHDNLRGALQWLLEQGMVEEAHQLGAALWLFWTFHGHVGEGRTWLAKILAQPGGDSAAARVRVLDGAAQLALAQSDTAAALGLHEEELALAQRRGDQTGIAFALVGRGDTARQRGDYPLAHRLLEEGLTMARALGDRGLETATMGALGILADAEGDFFAARTLDEAVLRILRLNAAMGSERTLTRTLKNLGRALHRLGDYAAARSLLGEALARATAEDATASIAASVQCLGELALDEGDHTRARTLLLESAGLYFELGDRQRILRGLEALAKLEAAQARPEQALRLAGAAAAQREALQVRATPVEATELELWLDRSRTALSPANAESAWTAGRTLPLEQVVAEVRGEATTASRLATGQKEPALDEHHTGGSARVPEQQGVPDSARQA